LPANILHAMEINVVVIRVPTLPGKREKSLNFTEIAKICEKIWNFIAGQGSFVVPNLFGY